VQCSDLTACREADPAQPMLSPVNPSCTEVLLQWKPADRADAAGTCPFDASIARTL